MPLNLTRFGVPSFSAKGGKRISMMLSSQVWSARTGVFCPGVCFAFALYLGSTDFRFFPTTAGAGRDRHIDQGTEHRAGPCSSNVFSCAALPTEVGHLGCCVDPFFPRLIDVDACCVFISYCKPRGRAGQQSTGFKDCTCGIASAPVL